MIVATLVCSIVLNVLMGIVLIIFHQIVFGVLILLFSGILAFLYYSWRSRIVYYL